MGGESYSPRQWLTSATDYQTGGRWQGASNGNLGSGQTHTAAMEGEKRDQDTTEKDGGKWLALCIRIP
jgi:hypothetical protein